jgi:hypothetical protein
MRCLHCGRALPALARRDARYCSSACRSAAFRSDRRRLASELLDILTGKTPPVRWTEHSVVDHPTAQMQDQERQRVKRFAEQLTASLNSDGWRWRLNQVLDHRTDMLDAFGRDVLTAAATPVPDGCCRVCLALTDANVYERPAPKLDSATLNILGPGCPRCAPAVRAGLDAQVASIVAERAEPTRRRTTARAAAPTPGHSPDGCQACQVSDLAAALIARGSFGSDGKLRELASRGARSHKPQPGPEVIKLEKKLGQWHLRYRTQAAT